MEIKYKDALALALYYRLKKYNMRNKRIEKRAIGVKDKYGLSEDEFNKLCRKCYDILTKVSSIIYDDQV